jgi:pimeloyl-ACP methyl ester carboxylesterase
MKKLVFLHGLVGSKNNFKFLIKEFDQYDVLAIDLIGFGKETKPNIDYSLIDYLEFLENKLDLNKPQSQYIVIGHSLGALLSKELAIKYPRQISKLFLISYPFLDNKDIAAARNSMDVNYIEGSVWSKILCKTKIIYKWLLYPFLLIFNPKYHQAYMDSFKHTYRSAFNTIHNTILKDDKQNLHIVSDKTILINGSKDKNIDMAFAAKFANNIIQDMGHNFFGFENKIAEIIKTHLS